MDPVGFRHKRPDLDPTCQDRTLIIQKYLAIFKDTKKTVARVYYQIPICLTKILLHTKLNCRILVWGKKKKISSDPDPVKKDLGNLQLWPDLAIPVPFRRFLFFSNYFLLQQLCQLISDKCLEICLQNFTRSSLFFSFTTLCVLLSFPSTFEHLNITISVFLCTNWLKNLNWQHSDLSLSIDSGWN